MNVWSTFDLMFLFSMKCVVKKKIYRVLGKGNINPENAFDISQKDPKPYRRGVSPRFSQIKKLRGGTPRLCRFLLHCQSLSNVKRKIWV